MSKTKAIAFHRTQVNIPSLPNIILDSRNVELVPKIKLLGITLDSKLTWQYHKSNIGGRLSGVIAIINKLRKVLGVK